MSKANNNKSNRNRNNRTGIQKAAGIGASDVFQGDNKGMNGNMKSLDTSSSQSETDPCITNGMCERCPFNGDIVAESVSCLLCLKHFHALCRDKRAGFSASSICSKSFFEMFGPLSAHYGPNKSRWGRFVFICNQCNSKYPALCSEGNDTQQIIDVVSLLQSPLKQSPSLSNETQTLISGDMAGYSSDSDPDTDTNHNNPALFNDIKSLIKLNNEILNGIKSIQAQADANSEKFTEHVCELKNSIHSSSENSIKGIIDPEILTKTIADQLNSKHVFDTSKSVPNNQSVAQRCKPYNDIHTDFLDESVLTTVTDFLGKSDGFKTIKSKNFSSNEGRDVIYFGEFAYRYGAVSHEAKAIPEPLQPIITKITELYPSMLLNSCLVTRYKTGSNVCPPHSDDEPFISPKSNIFTLSIGCNRDMTFTSIDGTSSASIELLNNSLLSFSRSSQESWRHEITSSTATSVRYSLTFRLLAPYYANSTLIVGDSNTEHINFGSGRNKLGVWLPGERVKASKIANIPNPDDIIVPYRHMVIHTGINDLRSPNHLPIPILAKNLHEKCNALVTAFPKMKLHISCILPTKNLGLNAMANELNKFISEISQLHQNIYVISHNNLIDHTGKLNINLGQHHPDGTTVQHDHVHLGSKGIALFCINIKKCIIKMKSSVTTNNESSLNQNLVQESKYPYWFPNKDYQPNLKAPTPHINPWTGDHNWTFTDRNFQPFLVTNSQDGFQS